jgi:hypothetical protein
LNDNRYVVSLHFQRGLKQNIYWGQDIFDFEIIDSPETRGNGEFKWPGVIRPPLIWEKRFIKGL